RRAPAFQSEHPKSSKRHARLYRGRRRAQITFVTLVSYRLADYCVNPICWQHSWTVAKTSRPAKPRSSANSLSDAPIACHELDRDGKIVWVNAAECRLLGLTE